MTHMAAAFENKKKVHRRFCQSFSQQQRIPSRGAVIHSAVTVHTFCLLLNTRPSTIEILFLIRFLPSTSYFEALLCSFASLKHSFPSHYSHLLASQQVEGHSSCWHSAPYCCFMIKQHFDCGSNGTVLQGHACLVTSVTLMQFCSFPYLFASFALHGGTQMEMRAFSNT